MKIAKALTYWAGLNLPVPSPLELVFRTLNSLAFVRYVSQSSPHAGPGGRRIREACGHFRRPRKKKLQHSESCAATKQTQALYWLRLPDSFQMWFETTRFVYFVKLKHASRTFFDLQHRESCAAAKETHKLFTGFGHRILFKYDLKQDALYTSSS